MKCKVNKCQEKATEKMYFTFNGKKGKEWGDVCDKHSSMTIDELIMANAEIQILEGFVNKGQENTPMEQINIMTEKL